MTELSAEGALSETINEDEQALMQDEDLLVRYLISAKWWERWRDFTNFDQDFLFGSDEELIAKIKFPPTPEVDEEYLDGLFSNPGIIQNSELLLNEQAKSSCGEQGKLKPELT